MPEQPPKSPWPAALEAAVKRETSRHVAMLTEIIHLHPQYRVHIAYALLGEAVAICDSFGGDAEGFLIELRKREPKPPVLVPPKAVQS